MSEPIPVACTDNVPEKMQLTKLAPARKASLGSQMGELFTSGIWLQYLLGLLIGRTSLAHGQIMIGPAYYAALLWGRCNPRAGAVAGLFTLFGMYTVLPQEGFWPQLALAIMISLVGRPRRREKTRLWAAVRLGLINAVVMVGYQILSGSYSSGGIGAGGSSGGERTILELIMIGLGSILLPCLAVIFASALQIFAPSMRLGLENRLGQERNERPDYAGYAVFTAVMALGGGSGILIAGYPLIYLLVSFLILTATVIGGAGAAVAIAAVAALMSHVGSWNPTLSAEIFVTAGLLAGVAGRKNKEWSALGFCLGIILSYPLINEAALWRVALVVMFPATVLFLLVPAQWFSYIRHLLSGSGRGNDRQECSPGKIRDLASDRLRELAGIFEKLAHTFEEVSPAQDENAGQDVYQWLEKAIASCCANCQSYKHCWTELFYQTYREFLDLITLAEMKGGVTTADLPGKLAQSCIQSYQLVTSINYLSEVGQIDRYWRNRLNDSKELVSYQLKGVSGIMAGLAGQLKVEVQNNEDLQLMIYEALSRVKLHPVEVSVTGNPSRQMEIAIEKRGCGGYGECQRVVAPFLANLIGQGVSVWNRDCPPQGRLHCTSTYCLRRAYTVTWAARQTPKEGSLFCGDTFRSFVLKDGRHILLLSDGVGTGPRAALESQTTVSILEQLLSSGIDRDFALQMVNSVLLLRHPPEETFSTVDMVAIDLFSCEADFLKIGAAPSYIKRGREVTALRSNSLPAGILEHIEIDATTRALQEGDLLVMITDGIIDSLELPDTGDHAFDWVASILANMDVLGVQSLADYLLEHAIQNAGGKSVDDLTVLVAQIVRAED
jgi:stage II sporulation protein E